MRNLRFLYTVSLLRGLRFGFAVWVLYYLRFTNYAGIGLAETLTIAVAFAMEIPTGMLADAWGRKPTLVTSLATEAVGYLFLTSAWSLGTLLASLAVLQVGRALYSGTFEAFVYETLLQDRAEHEYTRTLGRLRSLELVAVATATLAGGWMYRLDPRLPYGAAAIAFAGGAAAAVFLVEPRLRSAHLPGAGLFDFRPAARALRSHRWITLPLLVVAVFLVVPDEVLDDVLAVEFGFEPQQLGALFAIAYLAAAFAARSAHRLTRLGLDEMPLLLVLAAAGGLSLCLSPFLGTLAGGVLVIVRYCLRAVHDTISSDLLNRIAPEGRRATLLSTFKTVTMVPYVAGAYAVGTAMDALTARTFAAWFGAANLVALLLATAAHRFGRRPGPSTSDAL